MDKGSAHFSAWKTVYGGKNRCANVNTMSQRKSMKSQTPRCNRNRRKSRSDWQRVTANVVAVNTAPAVNLLGQVRQMKGLSVKLMDEDANVWLAICFSFASRLFAKFRYQLNSTLCLREDPGSRIDRNSIRHIYIHDSYIRAITDVQNNEWHHREKVRWFTYARIKMVIRLFDDYISGSRLSVS